MSETNETITTDAHRHPLMVPDAQHMRATRERIAALHAQAAAANEARAISLRETVEVAQATAKLAADQLVRTRARRVAQLTKVIDEARETRPRLVAEVEERALAHAAACKKLKEAEAHFAKLQTDDAWREVEKQSAVVRRRTLEHEGCATRLADLDRESTIASGELARMRHDQAQRDADPAAFDAKVRSIAERLVELHGVVAALATEMRAVVAEQNAFADVAELTGAAVDAPPTDCAQTGADCAIKTGQATRACDRCPRRTLGHALAAARSAIGAQCSNDPDALTAHELLRVL